MDDSTPALLRGDVRGLVAKTVIQVLRGWSVANFGNENLGATIEANLIVAAIVVGQSEGRLMCASDISSYIGMPRATVIRNLHTIAVSRLLGKTKQGNRTCYFMKDANESNVLDPACKVIFAVQQCCERLSKMDTGKLDGKLQNP